MFWRRPSMRFDTFCPGEPSPVVATLTGWPWRKRRLRCSRCGGIVPSATHPTVFPVERL